MIDGDHNYYTVREELRLIGERAPGAGLPLLLVPRRLLAARPARRLLRRRARYRRRRRHPQAGRDGGLYPGDPGLRRDGLPYPRSAAREGGARQRRADGDRGLRRRPRAACGSSVVPLFFGLGVVWHRDAPWSDAVARDPRPVGPQPAARSDSRRTGCTTSRRRTPRRPGWSGTARARRRCCGGCWIRARSAWPSDCRDCGCRLGIAPELVGGLQGRDPARPAGLAWPRRRLRSALSCRSGSVSRQPRVVGHRR